MRVRTLIAAAIAALPAFALAQTPAAPEGQPPATSAVQAPAVTPPAAPVNRPGDFTRWEGRWYEAARLPNSWESSCGREIVSTVLRRTDGNISVIHQCRTPEGRWDVAIGQGSVESGAPPDTLGVRFVSYWYTLPPFTWQGYYAVGIDVDARYALFGSEDKRHLWILSQTREMDPAVYQRAVERAAALGYDTAKLIRPGQ